ncbi:hypothetical protein SCALM49S_08383 [Streptomyces californicus]
MPLSPLISAWERSAWATRCRRYRGAERGRYQRSASAYAGRAPAPARPSRQSRPNMPTVAMATRTPAENTVGMADLMPLEMTATSSPTRESTSPRPTSSTRALGMPSTARTASSRSRARSSAPSLPMRKVEAAVAAAPSSAAATISTPTVSSIERGSPPATPSTTRLSSSTGSTWSAAPATVVRTVEADSHGARRQCAATHRAASPPVAVRRAAGAAGLVSVTVTRRPLLLGGLAGPSGGCPYLADSTSSSIAYGRESRVPWDMAAPIAGPSLSRR